MNMRGGYLGSVLAGVLLVIASSTASAEGIGASRFGGGSTAAEPSAGIDSGGFIIKPEISVTETYNDNIFASQTAVEEDFITVISPSLRFESNWNNHALISHIKADGGVYADFDDENYLDWETGTEFQLDVTRAVQITGGLTTNFGHEDRGSPDDVGGVKPTETSTITGVLGFNSKANRVGLSLDGTVKIFDYDDVNTLSDTGVIGSVNNDDRDHDEFSIVGRASYDLVPGYQAFIQATYNWRNYNDALDDAGFNRNSDGYELVAGISTELTGALQGEAFVGYLNHDFDDVAFSDVGDYAAGVGMIWTPTALTTVNINLSRTVGETTTLGASGILATASSVSVEHELRRNVTVGLSAGLSNSDYQGIPRNDNLLDLSAHIKYSLNRNMYAEAAVGYKDRNSNAPGNDYNATTASVKVGWKF